MYLLRIPTLLVAGLVSSASAYFVVTAPKLNDQWANGDTRMISWVKGAHDGVTSFDIEMSRLNSDGLTLVAKNVPSADSSQKSINILLQDVPPGDDYFLLFLNSTHWRHVRHVPALHCPALGHRQQHVLHHKLKGRDRHRLRRAQPDTDVCNHVRTRRERRATVSTLRQRDLGSHRTPCSSLCSVRHGLCCGNGQLWYRARASDIRLLFHTRLRRRCFLGIFM
ncbi:hypothetical protein C8R46DRAFT_449942 [Mycena filopes]|nr:hypothetical protein C8R46DRAFT_449942 [Mycena filopes]